MKRTLLVLALLVALAALVVDRSGVEPLAPLRAWWHRASPPAPTVVFVVLDTARADRMSACGYDKPTTPVLERLVAEGASLSCRAYAPGDWTIASHASFFTGLPVTVHGVGITGRAEEGEASFGAGRVQDFETLSTRFKAQGYQTAFISGNSVLQPGSGLTRGFDVVYHSDVNGHLVNAHHAERLRQVLQGELDPERPLFLFLNFYEPHNNWDAVPEDLGWLPPRPPFALGRPEQDDSYQARFLDGKIQGEERARTLAWLSDAYDYGVFRADRGLGWALELLEQHGWTSAGMRLVVVADHGEFLGEHDRLWHGGSALEPNQRVPLLIYDTANPVPALPEPVSALEAYSLTLTGQRPAEALDVMAVATARPGRRAAVSEDWVAFWEGDAKLARRDEDHLRFDLAEDPGERSPAPLEDEAWRTHLDGVAAEVAEWRGQLEEMDPELIEALRAAGYLDP